jgi:hypothetical protein
MQLSSKANLEKTEVERWKGAVVENVMENVVLSIESPLTRHKQVCLGNLAAGHTRFLTNLAACSARTSINHSQHLSNSPPTHLASFAFVNTSILETL